MHLHETQREPARPTAISHLIVLDDPKRPSMAWMAVGGLRGIRERLGLFGIP